MSETGYGSLTEYLHDEDPELLEEVQDLDRDIEKAELNQMSNQVAALLRKRENQKIVQTPSQAPEFLDRDVDIVVHMGCHAIRTPHIIDGTIDVLESMDYTAVPLGGLTNCCGILDFEMGDLEAAERVDNNRFQNIEAFDPEYAITECTSCFATSDKLSMGYRDPEGYEFMSMIQFLYERRDRLSDLVEVTEPTTITLHDHYDSFGWTPLEEAEMARELFQALPGVDIVEMEHHLETGLPCNFLTDLSEWETGDLTEQLYREATETQADLLINFWHACHRNLVAYDGRFPIETRNYATFLGERLGFEYRDRYKEYTLAALDGDIEWILGEAKPVIDANGLSTDEARTIIADYLVPQTLEGC